MKRIITSALILALTVGAAQAQSTGTDKDGQKKEFHHKGRHGQAFSKLNLTEDQKAQLKSIPAHARAVTLIKLATSPVSLGREANAAAAKCSEIMSQPVSQSFETGARLRLATAAKALANRMTAAKSGSLPQSTNRPLYLFALNSFRLRIPDPDQIAILHR